ncbi:helicase-related protein [Novosphingobium sp. ST904]|uniref:helicase-related protein n=1 Tax=Novosphingobium sp. ST904 TaxID=1684385 RepID=UPI0006C86FB7|nr:helicase-related protein [Novosphingobium sp. ST904]KPH57428.1 helicase [Novosphingobium sp. ST904]TCM42964.1 ATP-dependent RNA helicase SUPV3L1/SUV3 [Novosphingobium sp. ST904]
MVHGRHVSSRNDAPSGVKAVLGPTNTGKTHLAIERLCAHSSGAIGFPLRLLAREVYDRVCKIKGERNVALITGEERIEPKDARYLLCTVEAMPVTERSLAFVAIDEAQLGADRERGHVFTDRLLHARGREETMILGSSTLEPMVKALVPGVEVITRPRFSTLSHAGARKLSRIPPRSAIVAFSAEQVYAIAEMLRRFRGGAAVVMGALSPQTRNAQVELYQSGEVDYLVATDAIGMGLNLDVEHVAFAGLSKFDGQRHRRLTTSEMAQIAGRAGRHQKDGTFGTLTGSGGHDSEFEPDEVYAIEEHRFPPLTKLFWREPDPRFDSVATLIADLETPPHRDGLVLAPEAIDLAVLKRLADENQVADSVRGHAMVRRFWEVCRLPDFRQQGVETHSRFVARLWQDLRHGELGADYMAQQIARLDITGGDIDTLQGRIAAIRSWAYIAQRPDWVLAREEMAARARAVEARLSDALHGKLTERFINRRTAVLMKKLGPDAGLLSVRLEDEEVLVEGEHIGSLHGFAFQVDPAARLSDRKLLLAAAERHLPALLQSRAAALTAAIHEGVAPLTLENGKLSWEGEKIATLSAGRSLLAPLLVPDRVLDTIPAPARKELVAALEAWLEAALEPLAPLRKLDEASRAEDAGPELRALLITLVDRGGMIPREGSGVDRVDKARRTMLAKLGVRVGALDLFVPAMLRPGPIALWRQLAGVAGISRAGNPPDPAMPPAMDSAKRHNTPGYRDLGKQLVRLDMAEKLLREAHEARSGASGNANNNNNNNGNRGPSRSFSLDPARAVSMGLTTASYARLLRIGGFQALVPRPLAEGAYGPPAPVRWRWRPPRREAEEIRPAPQRSDGAFAALGELLGAGRGR